MILIGLGGNLPSGMGGPQATCEAALRRLGTLGVRVVARSPWYELAPIPTSDQPWFINTVARVETPLGPAELLMILHTIEEEFGRARGTANAARTVDLDLLAYGDVVTDEGLQLPHPRLHERAFVLLPLKDVAPDWHHPTLKKSVSALIEDLPPGQLVRPLNA